MGYYANEEDWVVVESEHIFCVRHVSNTRVTV